MDYSFWVHAHSGWRWLVLLAGVIALVKSAAALLGKSHAEWTKKDRLIALAYPIGMDIQIVLGLVVWVMGRWWQGQVPAISWEHPVTMLIAVALAHVGMRRAKTGIGCDCRNKHIVAWYLASLLTVGLGIVRVLGAKGV